MFILFSPMTVSLGLPSAIGTFATLDDAQEFRRLYPQYAGYYAAYLTAQNIAALPSLAQAALATAGS